MSELFEKHDWATYRREIGIIGNKNEFLIKSLTESFKARGFRVYQVDASVDEISKIPDTVMLYVLIVDVVSDMIPILIYLKDAVFERQICPCLICEKAEIPDVLMYLPQDSIAKMFERPVNAKEIVGELSHLYDISSSKKSQKIILIVDDDPEYLRHMQSLLKHMYRVYMANSGVSALMLLSKHRVDLILLDYQMPVLDGVKTMEALRSEAVTADIPVMFLTGKQDVSSVAQAVQMKPVKYLLKSTPAAMIQQVIADFFMYQESMKLKQDTVKQMSKITIPSDLWS